MWEEVLGRKVTIDFPALPGETTDIPVFETVNPGCYHLKINLNYSSHETASSVTYTVAGSVSIAVDLILTEGYEIFFKFYIQNNQGTGYNGDEKKQLNFDYTDFAVNVDHIDHKEVILKITNNLEDDNGGKLNIPVNVSVRTESIELLTLI